ncbi:MAG: ATP-binding protein [Chthoniobacterales bacterium]
MNEDTPDSVDIQQVEQGLRTLTHDWRNVLNGINLRISSAKYAETDAEWESDLEEAHQLIVAATAQLGALSRRIATPTVTAIPYPVDFFLEDLAGYLSQHLGENALKLEWEKSAASGKVVLDFGLIAQAVSELIENSLRRLSADAKLSIAAREAGGFLALCWSERYEGDSDPETWGRQPFSSSERGRMGLGLYFARRVLAAHGGDIQFEQNALNGMLQTTVCIPMKLP